MPLRDRPFQDIWTFEGSGGTIFAFNGNIVSMADDTRRITVDPKTLIPKGVRVEPAATNIAPTPIASTDERDAVGGATLTDVTLDELEQLPGVEVASGGDDEDASATAQFSLTAGQVYYITAITRDKNSGKLRLSVYDNDNLIVSHVAMTDITQELSVTTPDYVDLLDTSLLSYEGGDNGTYFRPLSGDISETVHDRLANGTAYKTVFKFVPDYTANFEFRVGPNSTVSSESVYDLFCQVEVDHPSSLIMSASTRAKDVLDGAIDQETYVGGLQIDLIFETEYLEAGQVLFQIDNGLELTKLAVVSQSNGKVGLIATVDPENIPAILSGPTPNYIDLLNPDLLSYEGGDNGTYFDLEKQIDSTIDFVSATTIQIIADQSDITFSVNGETAISLSLANFPYGQLNRVRACDSNDNNQFGGTIKRITLTPIYVADYGDFLLEDSSSKLLLEDGTSILELG